MAEYIKAVIIDNPPPDSKTFLRAANTNTYYLTSKHIASGTSLSEEHPVRRVLAAAAVEGYLQDDNHKFLKETQEVTNFSADLLKAVKATLGSVEHHYDQPRFKDPLSGEYVWLVKKRIEGSILLRFHFPNAY